VRSLDPGLADGLSTKISAVNLDPPKFRRFERVVVGASGSMWPGAGPSPRNRERLVGRPGSVVFEAQVDLQGVTLQAYTVYFDDLELYLRCFETELMSLDRFDDPARFAGERFEIGYDTADGEDDCQHPIEGTLRVPGSFWQCFVFDHLRRSGADRPRCTSGIEHEIAWNQVLVPPSMPRTRALAERYLGEMLGTSSWVRVTAPDSFLLRR
jgi:hypothetical protein